MNYQTPKRVTTLVFIDAGINNYQQLVEGVIPTAEVFVLDQSVDGIEQISQVLQQRQPVEAVHLVSHGAPGSLYLGNSQLSLDTLKEYTTLLQQWQVAQLSLYGCQVAAGDAGAEFVSKLQALTGAEIAASVSLTGSAAQGGNWELEVRGGQKEFAAAFSPEAMASYQGILNEEAVLVKDINPNGNSYLNSLTNIDGTLYFRANDGNGTELWKSDGTADGTVLVKDINPNGSSEPKSLTNIDGTLYFSAIDENNDNGLWKSDGTADGTVLLKNIAPNQLTNIDGTLYFTAYDSSNGIELWKSDGTADGTVLFKDINSGSDGSFPLYLTKR